MTEQEIDTVRHWVDDGAPEGNPRDLPVPPSFLEGWRYGKPDIVINIGQDFLVPAGKDLYKYFIVPTNFTEGKWIRAAQVLPGNRKLVHHAHVYVTTEEIHGGRRARVVLDTLRGISALESVYVTVHP